jgi:hypothetical protein
MKVRFDSTKGFDFKAFNQFSNGLSDLAPGVWDLQATKPVRTSAQNKLIHALFRDLAAELNGLGIPLMFGKFQATFNPSTAKEFFKIVYLNGKRTSECNTAELSNAIEQLCFDVTSMGGSLSANKKDLESLLNETKPKKPESVPKDL